MRSMRQVINITQLTYKEEHALYRRMIRRLIWKLRDRFDPTLMFQLQVMLMKRKHLFARKEKTV